MTSTKVLNNRTNRNATFDVLKFILSLIIVAIHSQILLPVLFPWARIAVPLFFITSAYFFFCKIAKCSEKKDKNKALIKYVKRNLILYAFYFVLFLPYIVFVRKIFSGGIINGIINLLRSLFLSSTFPVSWYIQASIFATIIIFFASKKLSNKLLLFLSVLLYLFACWYSSYLPFFYDFSGVGKFLNIYSWFLASPQFNAVGALVWIIIGKMFAEGEIEFGFKFNVSALLFSLILLYVEWFLVKRYTGEYRNDCYVMLMPTAICIFALVKKINIDSTKLTDLLGKFSIMTYTTHYVIITVLQFLFVEFFSISSYELVFVVTVLCCLAYSFLILYFKKFKYLRWLKFAY